MISIGRSEKSRACTQDFVKDRIEDALSDTRVVLISGPRQSGKTTQAMDVAGDKTPFLTLDDANVLRSAVDDPVGFVRGLPERELLEDAGLCVA